MQLLCVVAFSDGKPVPTFPENALTPQAAAARGAGRAGAGLASAIEALVGGLAPQRQPPGAQIGLEFRRRQRLGIEKTLRVLAALVQQKRGLRRGLDALRDDLEPEIVRHRDKRAD